jgi:hypothetical protein
MVSLVSLSNLRADTNSSEENLTKKNLREQIKREAKYAKEKAFYHGKEYNLSETEIDPKTVSNVPTITPDYDFDMDDVYSDIQ